MPQFHVVSARYNFRGLALQEIKLPFEKKKKGTGRALANLCFAQYNKTDTYIYIHIKHICYLSP